MTDEASGLLRIALFACVASFVYGFVSYEAYGTWQLIALCAGPGTAGILLWGEARKHRTRKESRADTFWRFIGLPRPDPATTVDLAEDEITVIPSPSIWPFLLSVGTAILLTGFVFGAWLLVLGGALCLWALWGWVAACSRETLGLLRAREAQAQARASDSRTA